MIRSPELAAEVRGELAGPCGAFGPLCRTNERAIPKRTGPRPEPPKADAAVPVAGGFVASAGHRSSTGPIANRRRRFQTKNLVHYASREEAIQAGKKPCHECSP